MDSIQVVRFIQTFKGALSTTHMSGARFPTGACEVVIRMCDRHGDCCYGPVLRRCPAIIAADLLVVVYTTSARGFESSKPNKRTDDLVSKNEKWLV